MAVKISFQVNDIPPKKDGANSMWGKETEIPRLISLRESALEAMDGSDPFDHNIRLKIKLNCPSNKIYRIGDLDNFITGICDGLQAADPRAGGKTIWIKKAPPEIQPEECIAIKDDCYVVQIQAEKVRTDSTFCWYEIEIEGEWNQSPNERAF